MRISARLDVVVHPKDDLVEVGDAGNDEVDPFAGRIVMTVRRIWPDDAFAAERRTGTALAVEAAGVVLSCRPPADRAVGRMRWPAGPAIEIIGASSNGVISR